MADSRNRSRGKATANRTRPAASKKSTTSGKAKAKSRKPVAAKVQKRSASRQVKSGKKATTAKRPISRAIAEGGRGGYKGNVAIEMDGGFKTCGGGTCSSPTQGADQSDPTRTVVYCKPTKCGGEVNASCGCHLYSYPTPAQGADPPPMKDWKHVWGPTDRVKPQPVDGTTYECVCVK